MWLRQLADMVSAAVQSGTCPDGAERLKSLFEKLQKNNADRNLAAYVKFRQLTAAYVLSMQAPKADLDKIQTQWLKTLEEYVTDYPTAPDAAEAMLQMAITRSLPAKRTRRKKWYVRIVREFPDSPAAKKAAGRRPASIPSAKSIELRGRARWVARSIWPSYRGKVVLIQYWATWSGPSKADMPTLKELWNKYGRSVHDRRREPRQQREGSERLFGREPVAVAANLRVRRTGQPPGQRLGHSHRADDDPGRSARQGGQPRHLRRRCGSGIEEADPVGFQ